MPGPSRRRISIALCYDDIKNTTEAFPDFNCDAGAAELYSSPCIRVHGRGTEISRGISSNLNITEHPMARGSWITRVEISRTPRALNRLILLCIYGCRRLLQKSRSPARTHAHETDYCHRFPLKTNRLFSPWFTSPPAIAIFIRPRLPMLSFVRFSAGLCISGFEDDRRLSSLLAAHRRTRNEAATKIPKNFPAISQRAVSSIIQSPASHLEFNCLFSGISRNLLWPDVLAVDPRGSLSKFHTVARDVRNTISHEKPSLAELFVLARVERVR